MANGRAHAEAAPGNANNKGDAELVLFKKNQEQKTLNRYPAKLSQALSGALRTFSFWMANGSVGLPLLDGIDYRPALIESPSLMEAAYAIFANVIELSDDGEPINAKYAEYRAAQYIRRWCDSSYVVNPPFESWEVELY